MFLLNKYPDVKIEIYWAEENRHRDEFIKSKSNSVPTICNEKYEVITVGLPENTSTQDKTNEELNALLLKNINDQLVNNTQNSVEKFQTFFNTSSNNYLLYGIILVAIFF